MASLEQRRLDIEKQKNQLDKDKNKASIDYVQSIASGEKSGSLIPMLNALEDLKAFSTRMQAQKDWNKDFELDRSQALEFASLQGNVGTAISDAGLKNIDSDEIIKKYDPELSKKMSGEGFLSAKSLRENSTIGMRQTDKAFKQEGFAKSLLNRSVDDVDEREKLNKGTALLAAELAITTSNWKNLNKTDDTKALAANVKTLATEMTTAAASIGAVTKFYKSMDVQIKSTTGLIEEQQKFVTTQETLMKKVQGELDELSKWRQSLKE